MDWHYDGRDASKLALRVVIAVTFLGTGVPKALNWSGAAQQFTNLGLPGFFGPIVGIVETVTATLVLLGILHRTANYVLATIIAFAFITVHVHAGITPALQRDALLLTATLLLAKHGPGAYAYTPL